MADLPIATDDKKISCSFCGKSQEEVKKLIAGPNVYICNECVILCKDILVAVSYTHLTLPTICSV